MNSKKTISVMLGLMLSLLLIPAASVSVHAQPPAPAYVELDAVQLDQLVAPIALDPDSLVAQILTAATYPDQVSEADTWLNQNMNLPPDQRAAGANNMSWDPAVKGLIEFPSTLDNLAKNAAWSSQLGNAYFNQPGDVMNAVQAMRLQAQQSNTLVTTVQQRVVVEAGLIEIVPVNPAVVFVPYYNPWAIWGTLIVAYPGFVVLPPPPGIIVATGIAFDPGIALGVYAGFDWGFAAWAPAWDGGTVLFNHTTYISNSVTVFNHGYFGYHDRGVFEHGGRGVPHGYRACAHAGAARGAAGRAFAGRGAGHAGFGKPSAGHSFGNHAAAAHANAGHSSFGNHAAAANHAAANHSAGANHGMTNHATSASRASANRGTTTANRGSSAGRPSTAANRAGSSAGRGASANRGTSMASRGSSAGRGASASRGNSMANRGATSASRGNSMGNRGAASGSRGGSAMASRGSGAPAGRSSGGGHASGGHGGRGR